MPIIHFFGFGRTPERRRRLVEGITRVTAEAYRIPAEAVTVHVFDVAKDHVAHGGLLACDGGTKTIPVDKPWLISEY